MAEWWTKQSFSPPSGVMKPKPLASLNHLTVPVVRIVLLLSTGNRRWGQAARPTTGWVDSASTRGPAAAAQHCARNDSHNKRGRRQRQPLTDHVSFTRLKVVAAGATGKGAPGHGIMTPAPSPRSRLTPLVLSLTRETAARRARSR